MECHEADHAASKSGEGQISTGCPLPPFLDIINLACGDIKIYHYNLNKECPEIISYPVLKKEISDVSSLCFH